MMSPIELPVPRVEALLLCASATRDDGGAHLLRGVGDTVVALHPPPCTIQGHIFMRYATTEHPHAALVQIVDMRSGDVLVTCNGQVSRGGRSPVVTEVIPVTMTVQSLGPHAIVLSVNGRVYGLAEFEVRALPTE